MKSRADLICEFMIFRPKWLQFVLLSLAIFILYIGYGYMQVRLEVYIKKCLEEKKYFRN